MTEEKKKFKHPPALTTNGRGELITTEHLDSGMIRVTISKCGKEIKSYIEDPCKSISWWKLW